MNRSASSPRPSPPFRMEERVPGGRVRRLSGRFRGSKREIPFGRNLPPNRTGGFPASGFPVRGFSFKRERLFAQSPRRAACPTVRDRTLHPSRRPSAAQPSRALAAVSLSVGPARWRFHFPASLGSTVVTRFLATTDALTPVGQARRLSACRTFQHQRVSLITSLDLPTVPSPTIRATTGGAPAARRLGFPPIARLQASPFTRRLARPR
jgi:hypothetical protein